MSINYVIFCSYGNDSCALIQWAHEAKLSSVAVVYTDTKWAADGWQDRVDILEHWVKSYGFQPYRTTSLGFMELARLKKGFPTQQFQWCSYILKIEPGERWLNENDPEKRAICLVGIRREESNDRRNFPEFLCPSENHGGRFMLAPFVDASEFDRDAYLQRAGIEPLPHRSRECKCINSNRRDMKRFTPGDVEQIRQAEKEIGKNFFRPKRHMGASGIDQVLKWANSPRGKFELPKEENLGGCNTGFCE